MIRKIACQGCDLLIELPKQVPERAKLCCPRCAHTITRGHKNSIDYVLAIVISCFITLALSYSFSYISFETRGQFREISLIQATLELYNQHFYFLATVVFILTLLLPLLYLCLLLRLLIPIRFAWLFSSNDFLKPKPIYAMRLINRLSPWLMVDVFLIGVLVAIIKMWSLAELTFGYSFSAYVCFVLLFSYVLYLVDPHKVWQWINNES